MPSVTSTSSSSHSNSSVAGDRCDEEDEPAQGSLVSADTEDDAKPVPQPRRARRPPQ